MGRSKKKKRMRAKPCFPEKNECCGVNEILDALGDEDLRPLGMGRAKQPPTACVEYLFSWHGGDRRRT